MTSESLDFISLRVSATGVLDGTFATNGVARIHVAGFADNGGDAGPGGNDDTALLLLPIGP